ncbi:MAG: DUF559 domain-containing protein [Acidimicrobiales bacterium]
MSTGSSPWNPPVVLEGLGVTGVGQTLVELGAGLEARRAARNDPRPVRPDELVELAVECALREGVIDEDGLLALLASCGWAKPGAKMLETVLESRPFGAPPTESYLETRGVQVLRNGGVDRGQRQVPIHSRRGRHMKRVDLLLGRRVIVEFDGEEFHPFEQDHDLWSALAAAGYTVLMFTYRQVTRSPRMVVQRVQDALDSE